MIIQKNQWAQWALTAHKKNHILNLQIKDILSSYVRS